jgi:hypothetical protein
VFVLCEKGAESESEKLWSGVWKKKEGRCTRRRRPLKKKVKARRNVYGGNTNNEGGNSLLRDTLTRVEDV